VQGLDAVPNTQSGEDFAAAVSSAIPSHLSALKLQRDLFCLEQDVSDFFRAKDCMPIAALFYFNNQMFNFANLSISENLHSYSP